MNWETIICIYPMCKSFDTSKSDFRYTAYRNIERPISDILSKYRLSINDISKHRSFDVRYIDISNFRYTTYQDIEVSIYRIKRVAPSIPWHTLFFLVLILMVFDVKKTRTHTTTPSLRPAPLQQ